MSGTGEDDEAIGVQPGKPTLTENILAQLLTLANDVDVKQVLAKYNPGLDSSSIYTNIMKCTASNLRKAAQFMNNGVPLDETNHNITNWLITRIENVLPDTCSICVEFGTQPSMCCFLCGQGIHEKCHVV